jgi:hypothetical protein
MSDESNLSESAASATPHGPHFAEGLEPDFGLRAGVGKEKGGVCLGELLGALTCQSGAEAPGSGEAFDLLGEDGLDCDALPEVSKGCGRGVGGPNSAWASATGPRWAARGLPSPADA